MASSYSLNLLSLNPAVLHTSHISFLSFLLLHFVQFIYFISTCPSTSFLPSLLYSFLPSHFFQYYHNVFLRLNMPVLETFCQILKCVCLGGKIVNSVQIIFQLIFHILNIFLQCDATGSWQNRLIHLISFLHECQSLQHVDVCHYCTHYQQWHHIKMFLWSGLVLLGIKKFLGFPVSVSVCPAQFLITLLRIQCLVDVHPAASRWWLSFLSSVHPWMKPWV